jgi:hypothetical protein
MTLITADESHSVFDHRVHGTYRMPRFAPTAAFLAMIGGSLDDNDDDGGMTSLV